MKKKYIVILAVIGLSMLAYLFLMDQKRHSFTLTYQEEHGISEQIQPRSNTITVRSEADTDVVFTDVETGQEYVIGYLTPGMHEKITLEKGKWYSVKAYGNITVQPVDVRVN